MPLAAVARSVLALTTGFFVLLTAVLLMANVSIFYLPILAVAGTWLVGFFVMYSSRNEEEAQQLSLHPCTLIANGIALVFGVVGFVLLVTAGRRSTGVALIGLFAAGAGLLIQLVTSIVCARPSVYFQEEVAPLLNKLETGGRAGLASDVLHAVGLYGAVNPCAYGVWAGKKVAPWVLLGLGGILQVVITAPVSIINIVCCIATGLPTLLLLLQICVTGDLVKEVAVNAAKSHVDGTETSVIGHTRQAAQTVQEAVSWMVLGLFATTQFAILAGTNCLPPLDVPNSSTNPACSAAIWVPTLLAGIYLMLLSCAICCFRTATVVVEHGIGAASGSAEQPMMERNAAPKRHPTDVA